MMFFDSNTEKILALWESPGMGVWMGVFWLLRTQNKTPDYRDYKNATRS